MSILSRKTFHELIDAKHHMAISKIKLLIPQKLNIKMTSAELYLKIQLEKSLLFHIQRMCLWNKAVSLKLLIRSSLKLFLIQIW